MNIIAIDIGNTNMHIGLFLKDEQVSIESMAGDDTTQLKKALTSAWQRCPVIETSKEGKREGVIVVSSVKPAWTQTVQQLASEELGERIYVFGKDIPLATSAWVDEPNAVGTDRLISAAAAYAVAENAVVVADFGTAVTIDMVDENGVFQGGVIFPGFDMAARSLNEHTAQLPKVDVSRPLEPFGKNTRDAINCGIYYSAIGALEEVVRRYAEKHGTWPQTLITGSGAEMIKDDCPFVDAYVPNLVIKGMVLAYKRHLEEDRSGT